MSLFATSDRHHSHDHERNDVDRLVPPPGAGKNWHKNQRRKQRVQERRQHELAEQEHLAARRQLAVEAMNDTFVKQSAAASAYTRLLEAQFSVEPPPYLAIDHATNGRWTLYSTDFAVEHDFMGAWRGWLNFASTVESNDNYNAVIEVAGMQRTFCTRRVTGWCEGSREFQIPEIASLEPIKVRFQSVGGDHMFEVELQFLGHGLLRLRTLREAVESPPGTNDYVLSSEDEYDRITIWGVFTPEEELENYLDGLDQGREIRQWILDVSVENQVDGPPDDMLARYHEWVTRAPVRHIDNETPAIFTPTVCGATNEEKADTNLSVRDRWNTELSNVLLHEIGGKLMLEYQQEQRRISVEQNNFRIPTGDIANGSWSVCTTAFIANEGGSFFGPVEGGIIFSHPEADQPSLCDHLHSSPITGTYQMAMKIHNAWANTHFTQTPTVAIPSLVALDSPITFKVCGLHEPEHSNEWLVEIQFLGNGYLRMRMEWDAVDKGSAGQWDGTGRPDNMVELWGMFEPAEGEAKVGQPQVRRRVQRQAAERVNRLRRAKESFFM
jgi:hypothetical protein